MDMPIDKRKAEEIALYHIRENIGNIPHIGKIIEEEDKFIVSIEVAYPRIIVDEVTKEPKKTRFLNVGVVGNLVIDKLRGNIIDKPRFYDVQRNIKERLDYVTERVEKALVKIGASNFSNLPFPTHIHTPVIDIISWLLVKDKLEISELEYLSADYQVKYITHLDALEKVGLVERSGNIIMPGSVLVGIEEAEHTGPARLSSALTHFFREGYEYIESIRQVLGPHLTLSSIVYQRSLETEELIPFTFEHIEKCFFDYYRGEKKIKIPRYLMQLESIGILEESVEHGNVVWYGIENIFNKLRGDELIEPVREILI